MSNNMAHIESGEEISTTSTSSIDSISDIDSLYTHLTSRIDELANEVKLLRNKLNTVQRPIEQRIKITSGNTIIVPEQNKAGHTIYAPYEILIPAGRIVRIYLDLHITHPPSLMAQIFAAPELAYQGVGSLIGNQVEDPDTATCGISLINTSQRNVQITKTTKLGRLVFMPIIASMTIDNQQNAYRFQ